jgi:hypothetical protein
MTKNTQKFFFVEFCVFYVPIDADKSSKIFGTTMSMMTPVLSDLPCLAQGPGASDVLVACQRELCRCATVPLAPDYRQFYCYESLYSSEVFEARAI